MNRRELLLGGAALAACAPEANGQPAGPFPMQRGINLGNALEAPVEGEWGYRIEGAHLRAIAEAGFDGIRLPVRWDAHMDGANRIDPRLLDRVHEVASWAIDLDLIVQLDVHHFDALIADPEAQRPRFLALWRQLAESFAPAPGSLIFEPLNEPHGDRWRGSLLTDVQMEVISIIRESNPRRLIVLGPGNWQNIDALRDWTMPRGGYLAASVHYYEPHAFTHQGAEWLGANAPRFGRTWGTADDIAAVQRHIAQAARWGMERGVSMQLGEFGVNRALPVAQRALWTRTVREACEAHSIGWCAWDFAGAFPVWDRERREFIAPVRDALLAQ